MKKQSGFLQIIAVIILFVVIALLIGKNPVELWDEFIKPIINGLFVIIVRAIEFLISFFTGILGRA